MSSTPNPLIHNIKPLSEILGKEAKDIQRKDLINLIRERDLRQINLHYTALDGKLKELKIPVNNLKYADLILAQGERIDGSSVFKGVVDTAASDLYIVPIMKSAFLSPFEDKTLGIFCRFMDKDGEPAHFVPDNILINAHNHLKEKTGFSLNALGELEFYIVYDKKDFLFTGITQRGYHQSAPFVKSGEMINEMLRIISSLTGAVKYAHAEVGYIDSLHSTNTEIAGKCCEQYEIEFLPRPVDEMASYLTLAKWVVRNVAYQCGCCATFTPKLEEGFAGNGLHFHLELMKNGKNAMVTPQGDLSDDCLRLIGGLCEFAPSLTALGNSVTSAYLRLVPNQEAPTKICWSERNRSALVRVPLGWTKVGDLSKKANPSEKESCALEPGSRQTVELRSPDGSAHIHLLLAGVTLAACHGLTAQNSLALAKSLHIAANTFKNTEALKSFNGLPQTCYESAQELMKNRGLFEENGIFPPLVIDYIAKKLEDEDDKNINERFGKLSADKRLEVTRTILHKDLHKH